MWESLDTITRLIIAISVSYNIWQTWRVKKNVHIIEKATNSMKDALIEATSKASLSEGTAIGLEQGRNEPRK